jgi:hypothetical protein
MRTLHGDEPRVIEGFVAKAECPFLGETKFTLAQLRMKLVRLTSCFRFVKAADELRGLRFSIHRSSSLPYGRLRISRPLPRSRSATCSACTEHSSYCFIGRPPRRRSRASVVAWRCNSGRCIERRSRTARVRWFWSRRAFRQRFYFWGHFSGGCTFLRLAEIRTASHGAAGSGISALVTPQDATPWTAGHLLYALDMGFAAVLVIIVLSRGFLGIGAVVVKTVPPCAAGYLASGFVVCHWFNYNAVCGSPPLPFATRFCSRCLVWAFHIRCTQFRRTGHR